MKPEGLSCQCLKKCSELPALTQRLIGSRPALATSAVVHTNSQSPTTPLRLPVSARLWFRTCSPVASADDALHLNDLRQAHRRPSRVLGTPEYVACRHALPILS